MARMIPKFDTAQLEHSSEVPVYEALRDQLSDDFVVLHSYPWLRRWRKNAAIAEGEADFVVLHPRHGLLVLEVKGGQDIRYEGGRWFRHSARGPREFRDPFRQAQRNTYALLDIVRQRSGNRINKGDFVYGYAVVFPHADYGGTPPPQADTAIMLSRRHLPFIDQAIMRAFRAWRTSLRELRDDEFRILLYDCLMPKFKIIRRIGPDIASASEILLELTQQQAQVFEGLYLQDRVLVEGVAGSGKTFLALERALAFARSGIHTLFVCYNSALAAWLRRQVQLDPRTQEYRSLLTVQNFHSLAKEMAAKAGVRFRPAQGGSLTPKFWDEEVPDLLEQAVLDHDIRGVDVRYGAMVVDEAQDFSLGWWYALTQSLLRGEDSPVYAFMDPNQSLRGEVEPPPIDFDTTFSLKMNCRNTRKIAAASASLLDLESRSFARAPAGTTLRILRARSSGEQYGLVLRELRRLFTDGGIKPRQIAVIGPRSKARGSLASVDRVKAVPLITNSEDWDDGKGVLVTTSRSFKGLEADVILLYDLGYFGKLFQKKDLYVACTRARFLLIAIAHGDECLAVLEKASIVSEAET